MIVMPSFCFEEECCCWEADDADDEEDRIDVAFE